MGALVRTLRCLPVVAALLGAACSDPTETKGTTGGPPPPADAGDDAGLPPKPPPVPVPPLFIGSGGFGYGAGSAFPGAAAPAGLAKVGPDTKGPWGNIVFLHYSGYWYGDDTIQ